MASRSLLERIRSVPCQGLRARKAAPLLLARECVIVLEQIVTRLEDHDSSLELTDQVLALKRRIEALVTAEHRRLWGLPPAGVEEHGHTSWQGDSVGAEEGTRA